MTEQTDRHEELFLNRFFIQVYATGMGGQGAFRFCVSDDLGNTNEFSGTETTHAKALAVARRFAIGRANRQ